MTAAEPRGAGVAQILATAIELWPTPWLPHGLMMNGGVLHAFSSLEPTEWHAAISGYRFFGFQDIATLLERTASFDRSKSG